MGINIVPKLNQTAVKYATTRNMYGDDVFGATVTYDCLFRNISVLNRGSGYKEEVNFDGLLWLGPDAAVAKADIFSIEGKIYRVEEVIDAKDRLRTNTRKFWKCGLNLTRQVS